MLPTDIKPWPVGRLPHYMFPLKIAKLNLQYSIAPELKGHTSLSKFVSSRAFMILAGGAWRMRQKSAPSKKPEPKKGRPRKRPKQQQKLLLAKLHTRPELPESWRKRRKKELRLISGTGHCFILVLQVEKRWKEQPGPQHAESCTPAQSPPNGSGGACVHSASKHSIFPRPARTAEKGKTVGTKLPTNDDEQNTQPSVRYPIHPWLIQCLHFHRFFRRSVRKTRWPL